MHFRGNCSNPKKKPTSLDASSKNIILGAISGHPNFPKSPKTREINPPRPLDMHRVGRAKGPTDKENPGHLPLPGKTKPKINTKNHRFSLPKWSQNGPKKVNFELWSLLFCLPKNCFDFCIVFGPRWPPPGPPSASLLAPCGSL